MISFKMFIARNGHRMLAFLIAFFIWLATNMILKFVVPGPIYMEEAAEPYYAKRALLGATTFLAVIFVFPILSKTKWKQLLGNEIYAIVPLSLRFIFAGYFAMFWYNFLIDTWFSRVSFIFAATWPQYLVPSWLGCLSINCFLVAPWIIFEPWKKFPSAVSLRFHPNRITVYLALSLYFAMFTFFRFPIDIVPVIGGTALMIIGSAFCVKLYLPG